MSFLKKKRANSPLFQQTNESRKFILQFLPKCKKNFNPSMGVLPHDAIEFPPVDHQG